MRNTIALLDGNTVPLAVRRLGGWECDEFGVGLDKVKMV